ncbi:MAG: glutamine amidotransferase [Myxococcales bacterium]
MSTEQRVPRILIVQTGTAGGLVAEHGDYPDWFRRALGAGEDELPVLRAAPEVGGERFDRDGLFRSKARGILVTGSPHSVSERAPWMDDLAGELLRAGEMGTPVLGVCFGHQLLGKAAGGDVQQNPRGREIGTVPVQLTEAGRKDPLFSWAESTRIDVQATHLDAVLPLPPRATLLGSNENCASQAMRLSETVATVQFHPEVAPQALRALIRARAGKLRGEGLDPDAIEAAVRDTDGAKILRAFADQVRRA